MPKAKEDVFAGASLFYDAVSQGTRWPHVEEGGVNYVDIEEMSPQHAISAMRKLERWYEYLTVNQRINKANWPRTRLYGSSLYLGLLCQALGEIAWDHLSIYAVDPSNPSDVRTLTLGDVNDVAVNVLFAWQREGVRATPAGRAKILRDMLVDALSNDQEAPDGQ